MMRNIEHAFIPIVFTLYNQFFLRLHLTFIVFRHDGINSVLEVTLLRLAFWNVSYILNNGKMD